jgi:hypothetical protein
MNGLWKENLSGYDRKGNKRKKHTRKHTLKDKVKPLIKKFYYKDIDNDVIHNDANRFEYVKPKKTFKQSGWVETWRVRVERIISWRKPSYDSVYLIRNWSENIRTAYNVNGIWYDEYSHEKIDGDIVPLHFLFKEEVEYDEPIEIKKSYGWKPSFENEIFIYGKPLCEDWHNQYGFWSTRRRKYAQTYANRKTRAKAKNWLNKKDWNQETEIKNHSLEKSIAWEIY